MEHMALGVRKMSYKKKINLLIVCLGNICRSPALEIIVRKFLQERGLSHLVHVQSRGLSEKQVGKKIYPPIANELVKRGYEVSGEKASECFSRNDFFQFEYILAADLFVLDKLRLEQPNTSHAFVDLVSCWSPEKGEEIFDPYKEKEERLQECVDLMEKHARHIVAFFSSLELLKE